jgi:hypothetical protein
MYSTTSSSWHSGLLTPKHEIQQLSATHHEVVLALKGYDFAILILDDNLAIRIVFRIVTDPNSIFAFGALNDTFRLSVSLATLA